MIEILVKAFIILSLLSVVFFLLAKKISDKPYGYIFWVLIGVIILDFILLVVFW